MLAVIVSVRSSSSRLPNKALLKIKDEMCAIEIVIERAKMIGLPVILATSKDNSDNELANIGRKHNVEVFRGALINKIKRWHDCFKKYDIELAIEIDGDDLCYNFDLAKRALNEYNLENEIMISPQNIIVGFFTYIISKKGIEKLFSIASDENLNTDVITRFIEKAKLKSQILKLEENETNKNVRLTLDYEEDLEFFQKLYQKIDILTPTNEIVDYLSKNPKLVEVNFSRHKDFLKNQAEFNAKIK